MLGSHTPCYVDKLNNLHGFFNSDFEVCELHVITYTQVNLGAYFWVTTL